MSGVIGYIGLGSNLSDPVLQVKTALSELASLPQTQLIAQSSLYCTPPMGPPGQPDYINAVAALQTELPAEALLDHLQQIEQAHQRKRIVRWGPRTLDLDILLYGESVIHTERLKVPHPGLTERLFVVEPLFEIAPDLILPDGKALAGIYQLFKNEIA